MPLPSCYSSLQIPPYIGLSCRERDEPGFMPLVLYMWMATLMRTKDRTENVMIFERDVHMAAKVAALDDPPQVCSLQLTKHWARIYHHEVTQRVQAGLTRPGWRSASSGSSSACQCRLRTSTWGIRVWRCPRQRNQVSMPMQKVETKTWMSLGTMTMNRCSQDLIGDLLGSPRRFGVPGWRGR